jgi:hypothetical protein
MSDTHLLEDATPSQAFRDLNAGPKAPLIVGIGHVARVGKDTAAEALCRDLQFVRRALADPLKELAMKADPLVTSAVRAQNINVGHGRLAWVVQGLGWDGAKDSYTEVRAFLQRLGVGARETFGETFWLDQLFSWIDRTGAPRVVVPDVRFINEAEAIKAAGGVVIKVNRPGHVPSGHVSETELANWDGWDRSFNNDRWVADLQADVVNYVKELL